jgi:hypothetical protein
VALLLLLSWAGAPPATANEGEPGLVTPPGEAVLTDLEAVAAANCWTLAEAEANHRAAEVVGRIAARIEALEPARFVGSAVGPQPGTVPRLYIKGKASEFVRRLVSEATIQISVIDEQPYSFTELEDRAIRVQEALRQIGFEDVSTAVDVTGGGRIPVTVRGGPATPSEATLLDAIPADLRDDVVLTITLDGEWTSDQPLAAPDPSASPGVAAPSLDPCATPAPGASPSPAGSVEPSQAPPFAPTVEWGPMAVVHDPGREALDAGLGPGRLVFGEQCVLLQGESGPGTTLIWRDGQAQWDGTAGRINFREVTGEQLVLADGDRVMLGGYDPTGDGPPLAPWVVQPGPACPTPWWVVHSVVPRG